MGKPTSSGGDFPVSIAYSYALHNACVLYGGKPAGIQCYKVDDYGLHLSGSFIPLDLNQTSPPHGPMNTVSDIVFNPSGTSLFASVKGFGNTAGHFVALPVVNGQASPGPRISRPPGFFYEWSISFINDTTAAVSDPAIGAAFAEIAYPSLEITLLRELAIRKPDSAFCWSQYSERFNDIYFLDGYSGMVPVIDLRSGLLKYNLTAPVPKDPDAHAQAGLYDSIVAGAYLYVLAGVSQIPCILTAWKWWERKDSRRHSDKRSKLRGSEERLAGHGSLAQWLLKRARQLSLEPTSSMHQNSTV